MYLRKSFVFVVIMSILLIQGCGEKANTDDTKETAVKQLIHTESEKKIEKEIKDLKAADIKEVSIYALDYKTYIPVNDDAFKNDLLSAVKKSQLYSIEGIKQDHAFKTYKIELNSGKSLLLMENDSNFVLEYEEGNNTKIIMTGAIKEFAAKNKTLVSNTIKALDAPKSLKDVAEVSGYNIDRATVRFEATDGWEYNLTDKNKIAEIVNFFVTQQYKRVPDEIGTIKKAKEPKYYLKLHTSDQESINIYLDEAGGKKVYIKHKVYTINDDYTNLLNSLKTLNNK